MNRVAGVLRSLNKRQRIGLGVGAAVVAVGIIGAAGGSGGSSPVAVVKPSPSPSPSSYSTAQLTAIAERAQARQAARYARQEARRAAREANQPRLIEYYIRGTTNGATITYTSTGNGTVQRDVGVLTEWRSGKAKLRPGDFAQFSAQNSREYGTVSCKIIEHMPDGSIRHIAPVTTSSGAFTIVDCDGDVR